MNGRYTYMYCIDRKREREGDCNSDKLFYFPSEQAKEEELALALSIAAIVHSCIFASTFRAIGILQ